MSANHKLIASVARGEAIVLCPCCPEDSDGEGIATVGGDEDERRPGSSVPFLEGFVCESGHTLADLNPTQEGKVLESAVEWLHDAIEAMRDAHWDAKIDEYRNEERYG